MRRELTAFRVEPEIMQRLRDIKAVTGVSISTQVNLALRHWTRKPRLLVEDENVPKRKH